MKRSDNVSPIFSLADTISHTTKNTETFEDFGSAHDGHHIGLFFRKLADTPMSIDYQNPFVLNRFCKMYNFVNGRGSVYGHLFVVSDPSKVSLTDHRLIITCNKKEMLDYAKVPLTSDRLKLLILKTSTGSILAISGHAASKYLVTEPT
jgi:hypothetical protein